MKLSEELAIKIMEQNGCFKFENEDSLSRRDSIIDITTIFYHVNRYVENHLEKLHNTMKK